MTTSSPHVPASSAAGLDDAARVSLYETMVLCRTFEDVILREHPANTLTLGAGRESVAAGVCAHLTPDDALRATYLPHHLAIARGVDLTTLTAEILGPAGHPAWTGSIGEGLPSALGQAFAFQRRGGHQVAVAVTRGPLEDQDPFPGSVDLAAAWKLPVVFVLEDAEPAGPVRQDFFSSVHSSTDPPTAYAMPGIRVEADDVDSVYAAAGDAVRRARSGEGPTLLEVHASRDPVSRYEERLLGSGVLEEQDVHRIAAHSRGLVEEAIERARGSPGRDRSLAARSRS